MYDNNDCLHPSLINATSEIDVLEDELIPAIIRALRAVGVYEVRVGSYGAAAGECLGIKFAFKLDRLEAIKVALRPWGYEVSGLEEYGDPNDNNPPVEVVW